MPRKENKFSKMIDTRKDDMTQSNTVGFEVVLEQAVIVYLSNGLLWVEPM